MYSIRVVPIDDSIMSTIVRDIDVANFFVDSQDDIRLNLLLMYKLLLLLLLLGYQIAPLFHLSAALHTHAQMRIKPKYTSAVRAPSLLRHFRHQEGSRTVAHTVRVQAIFWRPRKSSWWYCACVELIRTHSSAAEYTLNAARTRLCARRNGTESEVYPGL